MPPRISPAAPLLAGVAAVLLSLAVPALLFFPPAAQAVEEARLRRAATEDANWLTYGNGWANHRYAGLRQITRENVGRLAPAWMYQTGMSGTFQTNPIVVDGTVYITTPRNHVVALDGATGEVLWTYRHDIETERLCCGTHNRGPAVGYGRLYQVTADARLIALELRTGEVAWDVPVADPATGAPDAPDRVRNMASVPAEELAGWTRFMGNMAPLVHDGLVIVGTTGTSYSGSMAEAELEGLAALGRPGGRRTLRAFVSAYETETGRLRWRWYVTRAQGWEGDYVTETSMGDPLDRDVAAERAAAGRFRDAWKAGGGSMYSSPALDPELGLLYIGTGNAATLASGEHPPGDNLYTASLVALDVASGALRWHHQITPHDIWGYDVATPPVLLELTVDGRAVPGLAQGTKSGWVYFFDRRTGALLHRSEPLVPQQNLFRRPREGQPVVAMPGSFGGPNWPPFAFSPETGWLYATANHAPSRYAVERDAEGRPVAVFGFAPGAERHGTLSALAPDTGRIVWQQRLSRPFAGGVTATAGGLLFVGESDGHLSAYDARDGSRLWRFQTGAGVNAPPVVYEAAGRQFVIAASGGTRLLNTPPGGAVIAFALPPR